MSAKYARPEIERRWLVAELPDLSQASRAYAIKDRYLTGTRMRLRSMKEISGGAIPVYKLGQKLRRDLLDPRFLLHTTLYLDKAEFELLAALEGRVLEKVRHVLEIDNRHMAVDVFRGRHEGLALVEIGVEVEGDPVTPPSFAGREVSADERFTGGWLAFASAEELAELLSEVRTGS